MHEAENDKKALAALYNEAGGLCRDFSRYEEAKKYYDSALDLIAELEAEGSESHGATLINYGTCLGYEKKYEQAATYVNLSNIFWARGELDEAKVTLLKALEIYKERPSLGSEGRYAAAASALANVYYSEGEYERAAVLCQEAMDELEREFGRNDAWKTVAENLREAKRRAEDAGGGICLRQG